MVQEEKHTPGQRLRVLNVITGSVWPPTMARPGIAYAALATRWNRAMSPTVHREAGYVFYFVSFDVIRGEPPHVHVGRGRHQPGRDAKIWLDPVRTAKLGRFGRAQIQEMVRIVEEQQQRLLEEWHDYQDRI
jgi:hypothetical protein